MNLIKLLVVSVHLIVLNSCSKPKRVCTMLFNKPTYRIAKLDYVPIYVNSVGGLDKANRIKAFTLIQHLRLVEDYYYKSSEALPDTNTSNNKYHNPYKYGYVKGNMR